MEPLPGSCTFPGEPYCYLSFQLILLSQCEQCALYRRKSSVEQLGHLEGKELGFGLLDLSVHRLASRQSARAPEKVG